MNQDQIGPMNLWDYFEGIPDRSAGQDRTGFALGMRCPPFLGKSWEIGHYIHAEPGLEAMATCNYSLKNKRDSSTLPKTLTFVNFNLYTSSFGGYTCREGR